MGEYDFLFLHLRTFKARFLHLRLEIFLHLWLKKFLQPRVIFANEVDSFTFVVDFYICGCNMGQTASLIKEKYILIVSLFYMLI